VGRYRIVARLGAGGMGRVYLGRSPGGRQVAVKVVRPELGEDRDFRLRFVREVVAARRVNGAYTAGVVDADPEASPPWLATVYVPGPSLADAVSEHGPWPAENVLALGAALAEALESIHQAGVVHRDLKPSNILLAQDGPRVIDFGISVAADASALTHTGMVVGTPGFMSPEQLTGAPVGPASDVFSLGAVLAFTATGEGPFGIGSAPVLGYRVVHEEPDLGALPPVLRSPIAACLAKDPRARPTVDSLLERLSEASGDSVDTVTTGGGTWLPGPLAGTVRERATASLPGANPAAPTGASPAVPASASPAVPADPRPGQDPRSGAHPMGPGGDPGPQGTESRTASAPARTPAASPTVGTAASPLTVPLAIGEPRRLPRRRAVAGLAGLAGLAAAVGSGAALWRAFAPGDDGSPEGGGGVDRPYRWRFRTGAMIESSPAVADGVVYVGSGDGGLYAVDAASGTEVWRFATDDVVTTSPAVAGGVAYVSGSTRLYAVDAGTGQERWRFEAGDSDTVVSSPTVADEVVYVGGQFGGLYAVDAASGAEVWRFATDDMMIVPPTVVDGVVYAGNRMRLYALDAGAGTEIWRFEGQWDKDSSPTVAEGVLYACDGAYLYALDAASGRETWKSEAGGGNSSPAVADGMVYVTARNGMSVVDAATGTEAWRCEGDWQWFSSPTVTDGAVYFGADSSLRAVDASTGERAWRSATGAEVVSTPAVADGVVYVGSHDSHLYAVEIGPRGGV
ncbi:PQQ-binding-like beta-propeller repeat protein, partial [Streptomyces hainanensis]